MNNTLFSGNIQIIDEVTGAILYMGLSTYHIRRKDINRTGELLVYSQGSMITVTKNRSKAPATSPREWKRGRVQGFSKASRIRMMRTLARVNKEEIPYFVTLTYPKMWAENPKEWKRHLDLLFRRIKYKYPNFSAIWKLEFQKRGAPHYHLFIWGVGNKEFFKVWISRVWFEVVGSGDIKHLKAGTQVQNIKSWRGVMSYSAKYMSKEVSASEVGRLWGVVNRDFIPWSSIEKYKIFPRQVILAMRYMRRFAHIKSRDYASLTIFTENPKRWAYAVL